MPINSSEIKQQLLSSGIATLCWGDARSQLAEYAVRRVPHTNDAIDVMRYPSTGGQQTRSLRRPPGTSDTGFTLTDEQWAVLEQIADAG